MKETDYATGNIPATARLGSAEKRIDASPASIEAFSPSKARTNSLPDSSSCKFSVPSTTEYWPASLRVSGFGALNEH